MMESRMTRKGPVRFGAGEKPEITSKAYLSLSAGDVLYPTRGELLAELTAARQWIAALEAELASVRGELEEAREARRRLESLLADLRRLVA